MELFEKASLNKYRFPSVIGLLTAEQLWDLPLTSKNKPNLDDVAKAINSELKGTEEESFVSASSNSAKASVLSDKLDIVKRVIAYKQEQNAKARNAAKKAETKRKLLDSLDKAERKELDDLTPDQIREKLKELEET